MPKLRPTATYEARKGFDKALESVDYIYQGCINCENFNEPLELCKLASVRPPVRVILFGCPKWEFNGIPF